MSARGGFLNRSSGISPSTRQELVDLARCSKKRSHHFQRARPTVWQPGTVEHPNGILPFFSDITAWEFIASHLEDGEEVEVIDLTNPPGAKGYVMKIDLGPALRKKLYVKLELGRSERGRRMVFGRSFHYSRYSERG